MNDFVSQAIQQPRTAKNGRMNCSICRRPHSPKKLPFLCAVDARNRLYENRIEIAKALIENEEAERQIEIATGNEQGRIGSLGSEEQAARDRTVQIIAQADRLRAELEAARKDIDAKKDVMARRRADLASVSSGSMARKSRQLEEMEKSLQRTKFKWNRSSETMAATRAFLCEEAARLYGLRQVKKGSVKRYEIGGVEILELHAMNNASPKQISTYLAHIAHILVLASHYLAIRLPAEITLPHRDHPRPTIYSLMSSYRHTEIPAKDPGAAASTQPPAGLGDEKKSGNSVHVGRPRTLHLDRMLSTLARDDPPAYSLFIEGVSLLAYDIAWACCSQGVSFGDKDPYEDVCNMGQNLWRLLIGDQVHRRSVEPTFPSTTPGRSPAEDENAEMMTTKTKTMMGRWSHGTTYAFLGGADGTELVKNFKIMSPSRLSDQVKKRLSSEAPMLEWETIEGHEAEDILEDGILVHGRGRRGSAGRADPDVESVMSARTGTSAAESDRGNPTRGTGGSGWTKLKNR